ncbi:MAG: transglutaminase [Comamonadaceae bacterium PBBC1]|nr:MAG: transglutaminase [Comamonadaceae bacterium PBBC1]
MFQRMSYQRIALAATLWWSCQATSIAQPAAFTPNATVLKDRISYVVQADGRYTKEVVEEIQINTDQGVKERSQLRMPFSTTLQALEVLQAYTITKDGKRIDVKPEEIREQQSPASAGAPMFDDHKVKVVIFPAVEVGARLGVHSRMTQKTPLFKGHFYELEAAWPQVEFKSFEITVKAPKSMKLQVAANKMNGGEVPSEDPAQQVWKWSQENVKASPPEMAATSPHERIPHVAMTSFASYADAAKAYLERAQSKSAVTPSIQKLADDITQGMTDRRQQAQVLYQWVNHNIRYVAIFLGFGGVVPHEAQAIADARYGDCKDKTTLLQALLSAKGIASSTALINATDVYWLPSIAMPTTAFNHAITYIPEFNLFLDATPGKAMFGTLSPQLLGKHALVIQNAKGEPEMMKVPLGESGANAVQIDTVLELNSQGQITGRSKIQSTGYLDLLARQIMSSLPPGVEPQLVSQLLTMSGQSGSGNLIHKNEEDTSKPYSYEAIFVLPNAVQLPGPGAMAIPQGIKGFSSIANTFAFIAPELRTQPLIFGNGKIIENMLLKLPQDISVSRLPAPVSMETPFGRYISIYELKGRELRVQRQLVIELSDIIVQPKDYPQLRSMGNAVMRDLRSQVVY